MVFIGVIAFLLALWQASRALEKKDFLEKSTLRGKDTIRLNSTKLPPELSKIESWNQRKLLISGFWVPGSTIYLDNRSFDSKPGVHVVSAFQLENKESVIWVNRGWAPKLPGEILDNEKFIDGESYLPISNNNLTELEGIAHTDLMKRIELTSDKSILMNGSLWQNLDWNALHIRLAKLPLVPFEKVWPFILWQTSKSLDGLEKSLPKVKVNFDKHIGYSVQWFLLGLVSIFFAFRLGGKKD